MSQNKLFKSLCGLAAVLLFTACSGGGDTGGTASTTAATGTSTGVKQGVAVDPYIAGAVFQEVAADGVTVLQRQSTPSDDSGVFTFPQPLTAGSTVEMKASSRGMHGGAPFQGLLQRHIGDGEAVSVVVTPLTTMLAQGVSTDDALQALQNAGFKGLTAVDLYGNPMSGLPNLTTGITDQDLELLRAAMAVEAFMEITGNFRPTLADLTSPANRQIIDDMAQAVKTELNATQFNLVRTALAGDPQVSGQVTMGDMILAVVNQQQSLIAQVRDRMASGGGYDSAFVAQTVQNNLDQAAVMVKEQYMARLPQSAPADGATLYADDCAACHGTLANSNKAGRSADQISAAIAGVTAMNSSTLTALTTAEIQAIADVLAGTITPPPPATPDGTTLYADDCAACHGSLATTSKPGRTAADIQNAITTVSAMNSATLNALTADEIQAIADVLPPAPTTATTPDGVALYDSECSGCHGPLATSSKAGRTADQISAAITAVSGMNSLSSLTRTEIKAITDALATSTPPRHRPLPTARLSMPMTAPVVTVPWPPAPRPDAPPTRSRQQLPPSPA